MTNSGLSFLLSRRFFPLFVTQFLGAFNDNLFRQAILILITFGMAAELSLAPAVMNNMAVGLFILPFFLFSALAGQLADKYEKTGQIFWIKVWEICLMLVGAVGFYLSSLPLLIAVLTGLGLQSTFFGPIKYSVLPDLMHKNELLAANAMVEAGTFISILLGTLIGGFVMALEGGHFAIAALTITVAVVGTLTGRMVPKTGQAAPDLVITPNIFASTGAQLRSAWSQDISRRSILGISWIWLYGSLYISQMPVVARYHLGGDETVVTLFMACFSIGIGVGSFLCSKLLKGIISARLARPAFLAMIVLSLILYSVIPPQTPEAELLSLSALMAKPVNWLITGLLLLTSISTGIVIVPLYAILQDNTDRTERSRMIAATNIVNSGFMAVGAICAAILISLGLATPDILLIIGVGNLLILRITDRLHNSLAS